MIDPGRPASWTSYIAGKVTHRLRDICDIPVLIDEDVTSVEISQR
jgi:hypothetical protein